MSTCCPNSHRPHSIVSLTLNTVIIKILRLKALDVKFTLTNSLASQKGKMLFADSER